jgi:hypothetical protein
MVHALQEAHRVLQPNGILIDLRPAPVHRRVGIQSAAGYKQIGVMREILEDDYAANRAVTQVTQAGLFKPARRMKFNCNRVMDGLNEFHNWLDEFVSFGSLPSHAWLEQRVERAYHAASGRKRVIVSAPLILRPLRKSDKT